MSIGARLEMLERLVLRNPFIPHEPFEKQIQFLADFRPEVLYGGQAGGGKSDALLAAALMFVEVPGYAALLLRRSYQDLVLPEALISRAHEWLAGTGAHWSEVDKQYTFPSGATLNFGYLERPTDHYRYQGARFDFIGFDELTQFPTEEQYTYLFSRLRRAEDSHIMPRMRAATNPGHAGHQWVRRRFFEQDEHTGQWTARLTPEVRFIGASYRDNPHLDQNSYEKALDKLDPVSRKRLKYGSWEDLGAGELFSRDQFVVVDKLHAAAALNMVRFWDLAAGESQKHKRTAGILMGLDPWRVFWIADMRCERLLPGAVRDLVRSTAELDGTNVRVRMQQDPGQAGKDQIDSYARLVLPDFDFAGISMTGSKWDRAVPVAAEVDQRNVRIVRGPWMYEFFAELEGFAEDPKLYTFSDQVDAFSGAYHTFIHEMHGNRQPGRGSGAEAGLEDILREYGVYQDVGGSRISAADFRGAFYG